jgi:iron complex transport system substrate-binding protein
MRICSLLPSATEIVYALGLGDKLVAVTHECDYPPGVQSLPQVTSSVIDAEHLSSREIDTAVRDALANLSTIYYLDRQLLAELHPDLILTQELCEVCAVSFDRVQQAAHEIVPSAAVISLEPHTLDDILGTILQVANHTGVPERGQRVVAQLRERIHAVAVAAEHAQCRPRVLALEWLDPPFAAGHWVPEMITLSGGLDPLGRPGKPSYEVSWDDVEAVEPDIAVLMPCGFNLERTVTEFLSVPLPASWWRLPAVKGERVYAVDGSSYFNRPGPRIVDGLEILARIIHPEIFGAPAAFEAVRVERQREVVV